MNVGLQLKARIAHGTALTTWAIAAGRAIGAQSQSTDDRIDMAAIGLVRPDELIEPYEHTLKTMGAADRRSWAGKVLRQLDPHLVSTRRVIFFAGERYREFLVESLRERGISVEVPMEGLSIGRQLDWLTEVVTEPTVRERVPRQKLVSVTIRKPLMRPCSDEETPSSSKRHPCSVA